MSNPADTKQTIGVGAETQVQGDGAPTVPFVFMPPAGQQDFPDSASKQAALVAQWNLNLNGFTNQGITGNPWNATNSSGITHYFNPIDTPPTGAAIQQIQWKAFPGRIGYYFPNMPAKDQLALADTGYKYQSTESFPEIPGNACVSGSPQVPYGPYGPRGWQDEYCEWAVQRDAEGNIVRVDFTCENPEYWNTLWLIDPQRVLELYRSTLAPGKKITLDDLYLKDQNGKVVIDPSTGRAAYNPLNRWNSGPSSDATQGGAMHLTSTPNSLQTEIGLASAATVQRPAASSGDANTLICCAQYGQPHRNSDPNIGYTTNQLVAAGLKATLANPPGLYIQMPNFSGWATPDNTDPSTFWRIVRGVKTLKDASGKTLPGNFILHAVYEVPAGKGYTVGDITINGQKIQWAGQIAQCFNMQIVAAALPAAAGNAVGCVGTPSTQLAQPLQLFYQDVYVPMAAQMVPNPVNNPIPLLSNSTFIAPFAKQGATGLKMVLTCASAGTGKPYPAVTFTDPGVTATVTGAEEIDYAVPGNSYPSQCTALFLDVSVESTAPVGPVGVYVTNSGQSQGPAMPSLLTVVAPLKTLS